MERNGERAMMSSDGNKKEEKGDEEVIILCSSRTSRFRRLDETKIHPKFIRETTVSPVLSTSNVRRNSSSSPVPSVRRIKRCPISDKAISANDQRTRPRYYRIPENQSLSMLELHRGWLLCDFCKGQKMNVKSETNRIYGRCPSCRTGKRRKRENKILYLSGTLYIFHAFLQLESFGRAC
nr:uncharacterized protein LOC103441881 isoform X2 [Malus domestica]